jgi:hypothetical protein
MPVMNFESTLPMGAAELVRASAFRRSLDEDSRSDDDRITSRLSALDPSLHQDLLRFEQKGRQMSCRGDGRRGAPCQFGHGICNCAAMCWR